MIMINGCEVRDFRFPDNTFRLTPEDCEFLSQVSLRRMEPREQYINMTSAFETPGCANIVWKYEKPEELFMLQVLTMHLRDRLNVPDIFLFMPYIPNARMDRTKDPTGEVNVLKYFCRLINDLHFTAVTVADPHSDASVNQLDRLIQLNTADWVAKVMSGAIDGLGYDYFMFPDDGAAKRYAPVYNWRPYMVGKKDRDWATGTIQGLKLENPMNIDPAKVGDKRVLIIDDICSRGGTFVHAAAALKEFGFQHIGLCVTHLENTVFAGKLLKSDSLVEKIYTTDSLKHAEHDKICTVCLELG